MSDTTRNDPGPSNDWFLVAIVVVGCGVLLAAGLSWAAVQGAAWLSHRSFTDVGVFEALTGLPRWVSDPSAPAAAWPDSPAVGGPVSTGITVGLGGLVYLAAAGSALVFWSRSRNRRGLGTRRDSKTMSRRAAKKKAKRLRPTGSGSARSSGYWVGRQVDGGRDLYATVEDSLIVVAPSRSGKSSRFYAGTVMEWDGPVVVTETRPDLWRWTAGDRARDERPVWVWDPKGDWSAPALRWSPIAGCVDPDTARLRASSLVEASGAGKGVKNADFWVGSAIKVLQGYLHAAALDDRTMLDIHRWCARPTDREPVKLLGQSPTAGYWADELASSQTGDPETVSNIWANVRLCLASLDSPAVLEACSPAPGTGFDPAELLDSGGTVYFQGSPAAQKAVAPIIAAVIEAIAEEARLRAARSPNGRLADPLLLALDEAANVAPLGSMPQLLSEGGGSGIVTLAALQSPAQAHERWGRERASSMFGAATGLLVFGGSRDKDEGEAVSKMLGERVERFTTRSHQGTLVSTPQSWQESTRHRPVMTPQEIRTLPEGQALLLYRSNPAMLVHLPFTTERLPKRVEASSEWAAARAGAMPGRI